MSLSVWIGPHGGESISPPEVSVATAGDWFSLLKPRVMTLVVFTGLVGLLVAPGTLHPVLALTAILCIAVGAGAAGAINMWYDRDIDAVMRRTARRPIPDGRIAPADALGFGIALAVASVLVMGLATNVAAGAILAASILFYVFVYTMWLKRRTPQNIVIGGGAGAFPPLVGWAAMTGHLSWAAWLMFLVVFLWTPPHFWSLALYRQDDYRRARIPMMPVVRGERVTKWQSLVYAILLVAASGALYLTHVVGVAYLVVALAVGLGFVALNVRLLVERLPEVRWARTTFRFSLLYLTVIFAAMVLDVPHLFGG